MKTPNSTFNMEQAAIEKLFAYITDNTNPSLDSLNDFVDNYQVTLNTAEDNNDYWTLVDENDNRVIFISTREDSKVSDDQEVAQILFDWV